MGISLGIEAAVEIAEAAEAAGDAVDALAAEGLEDASVETIEGLLDDGIEAGTEEGKKAAEEALKALEPGAGDSIDTVISKLCQALKKVAKIVAENTLINQVFKLAVDVIRSNASSQWDYYRADKLEDMIGILNTTSKTLITLSDWLSKNSNDKVTIKDYKLVLGDVVSKFLPKLGASSGILKAISKKVSDMNDTQTPISDGYLSLIYIGVKTALDSLGDLAKFKKDKATYVPLLAQMPLSEDAISALKEKMPPTNPGTPMS